MAEGSAIKGTRAKLLGAILAFYVFSAVWTGLSFYLIDSEVLPLTEAQASYLADLSVVDDGVNVLGSLINLWAALALFLTRKEAPYLFSAGIALGALTVLWHILTKGWAAWFAAVGGYGLVLVMLDWGIVIWICVYSWQLLRQNALT